MSRFVRIVSSTDEKIEEKDASQFRTGGPPPANVAKDWEWLPLVVDNPTHDGPTQIKTGPVESRVGNEWHKVWTVRDKTAQEIDDGKDNLIHRRTSWQFKVALDIENRVRALEGKQPVTASGYRTALKARV